MKMKRREISRAKAFVRAPLGDKGPQKNKIETKKIKLHKVQKYKIGG